MKRCPLLTVVQAARIIRKGGVVAYPTETFYGLGARADNPEAVSRIFDIKGREKRKPPGGKPISILISSPAHLKKWASGIGSREKKLIRRFWPGPLTLVFKAKKGVNFLLTGGSGKIGIRVSSNRSACRLTHLVGLAITTTSANRSGDSPALTGGAVRRTLGKKIDGIVLSPQLSRSKGSTILDVSSKKIKVIREGEIPFKKIQEILTKSKERL